MNVRMFFLFLSIIVCFQLVQASEEQFELLSGMALKEIWIEDDETKEIPGPELELQNEAFSRGQELVELIRAKYKLINGDLKMSKFYLGRIEDRKGNLSIIKNRYLAIISFIEGNFNQSLNYLSSDDNYRTSAYSQICLLKLINLMVTSNNEGLKREKQSCMLSIAKFSFNEQFWLDTMIKLKLNDKVGMQKKLLQNIDQSLADDESSKLWLKTGLYLNKEKDYLDLISHLNENSYQSKRLREIVAFMYLRSGDSVNLQKALSFVDDIDSANAENIKGSINLKNKEYELAFGHFKLALQKKQDSTNALDRAIPLAWILGQWADGYSMLDNNTNKLIDPRNIRSVKIAFLIRDKQFTLAQKELTLLKIDFKNDPPSEVNIMDNYVSLIMGGNEQKFDKRKMEANTEKACRNFDGISCWTSLQFIQWKNLGKSIKREDDIISDHEMNLESLKEKKVYRPLREVITVDQKDIDELDSASI